MWAVRTTGNWCISRINTWAFWYVAWVENSNCWGGGLADRISKVKDGLQTEIGIVDKSYHVKPWPSYSFKKVAHLTLHPRALAFTGNTLPKTRISPEVVPKSDQYLCSLIFPLIMTVFIFPTGMQPAQIARSKAPRRSCLGKPLLMVFIGRLISG